MVILITVVVVAIIILWACVMARIASDTAEQERKLGVFWNGEMHKPIEGNEDEYLATRGLY